MNDFSGKKAWFSSSVSEFCKTFWLNTGGQIVGDILCADFIFAKNPEALDIVRFFSSKSYLEDGILPFKSEWLRNPSKNILDFILYPKDFKETIFPEEWDFEDEQDSPRYYHLEDFKNAKGQSEQSTSTSLDTPPISPSQIKPKEFQKSPYISKENNSETAAISDMNKTPIRSTSYSPKLKNRKNIRRVSRTKEMKDDDFESENGSPLKSTSPKVSARRNLRMELPAAAPQGVTEMEEVSASEIGSPLNSSSPKLNARRSLRMESPVTATECSMEMEEKKSDSEIGSPLQPASPKVNERRSLRMAESPVTATHNCTGIEKRKSESVTRSIIEDSPMRFNSRLPSPVAVALHDLEVQNHEFHSSMHDGFLHLEDLHIPHRLHLEDFLLNGKGKQYQVFLKDPP